MKARVKTHMNNTSLARQEKSINKNRNVPFKLTGFYYFDKDGLCAHLQDIPLENIRVQISHLAIHNF